MRKIKVFLFLLAGFCCFNTAAFAQAQPTRVSPEDWLMKKGKELVSILSEEETKTRYVKLRRIAKEVFHQKEMSRLAMGRYWRDFTPDQQAALQYLFFDYFVVSYGTTSLGTADVNIKITEKQPSGRDILLKTQISVNFDGALPKELPGKVSINNNAADNNTDNYFEILFALREIPSGYYIRDAKVEGQSILMFLRSQLESDLQAAGYDPNALLDSMRQKINLRYRAAEDMAKANSEKKQSAGATRL